jgi:two-component system, chemotaxis family, chemotaxis protein CheY
VALNVLVVDDSAVMRAMIIKTLRLCGIPIGEVHQAGNGKEGLEVLESHWVDLVLVDINMPVMNGEEMIEKLRANPDTASLAVIVVSTDGSQTRIDMMQRKGAGFVHKPFTPEILRDTIISTTGVSYEQLAGNPTVQGDGPDF